MAQWKQQRNEKSLTPLEEVEQALQKVEKATREVERLCDELAKTLEFKASKLTDLADLYAKLQALQEVLKEAEAVYHPFSVEKKATDAETLAFNIALNRLEAEINTLRMRNLALNKLMLSTVITEAQNAEKIANAAMIEKLTEDINILKAELPDSVPSPAEIEALRRINQIKEQISRCTNSIRYCKDGITYLPKREEEQKMQIQLAHQFLNEARREHNRLMQKTQTQTS